MAKKLFYNNKFTNGIIGPSVKMLGPVEDGGTIIFDTTPGCWGPMITPNLRGGHEVNVPVAVEGAKVGDAIIVKIKSVKVKSLASSSGVDRAVEGTFLGDPYVAKKCPGCGRSWTDAVLEGIGLEAIRCKYCGASASPFRMVHGYTMVFDHERGFGLTVNGETAKKIAEDARVWGRIPENSIQFSILISGKADLVGLSSRIRPFVGQLGTTPSIDMPDSHNAGDFGSFLVGAPHEYALTKEQLEKGKTDGHMDIDSVREGAIVICPVKVDGGGVYAGDMHAMQGDGEVAGHTTDVAGELMVEVNVVKGLDIDGPILLPPAEDLPVLARPFTAEEWEKIKSLGAKYGVKVEEAAPIQFVGTGPDLNSAALNGFERASRLLDISVEEVKNRVTICGGVEIGRLPGVVQVTLLVPIRKLEKVGLAKFVREQYSLPY
ncbi:MAG: acetamidase/formamidase family protein [Nitrososphaeria archaeon]